MSRYEDNHFDLAIVDPPYGIERFKKCSEKDLETKSVHAKRFQKMGLVNDIKPSKKYWDELFRVSKNQIIWGGNYFELPKTRGFLIWDKQQPFPNFSACEYAWTSFNVPSKIFVQATTRTGEKKIHPTQKSVKLYEFCLHHLAKENDKILDTHLGSGSIAIACHNLGYDLTACELDKEYYNAAMQRIERHKQQLTMF
tara:strand:- start:7 stop:597 length:591 start_codon:yes stop_codon:yes gene_type:complete